ncbi:MAG TPA: hypothetical protein PLH94_09595 [Fimbriimonadaceae bacterium]|nr:hypothetical protein [Fimbriimonadaceae bacterium]
MKHVVSVSLGTSKRNKRHEVEILGEQFVIERIGTDGDRLKFASLFRELDGQVDALGVGGADIYVVIGERKYAFREIRNLIQGAVKTPVVDGSGLKHTLERETIHRLQREGTVDFAQERVLLVSAVDRYGMAQALDELCPNVVYGDLMFGLGLPIKVRSYRAVNRIGAIALPIITKLPFQWFYPTGEKQESRTPKFTKVFDWATVIAGDSLYIMRYAPDRLDGKTIITQSLRKANLEWLARAGTARAITTTPMMGGETFATNVMEGVIVALLGRPPSELTEQDYIGVLKELGWAPNVIDLQASPELTASSPTR